MVALLPGVTLVELGVPAVSVKVDVDVVPPPPVQPLTTLATLSEPSPVARS